VLLGQNPDCGPKTGEDIDPVDGMKWSIFNPDASGVFLHRNHKKGSEGQHEENQ
jgi:hypothetical protein